MDSQLISDYPISGIRITQGGSYVSVNDDEVNRAIGKRIKEIRGDVSQADFLAALLVRTKRRISQAALSRMENGKEGASPADLHAIAQMDEKGQGVIWLFHGTTHTVESSEKGTLSLDKKLTDRTRARVSQTASAKAPRRKRRGG